MNAAPIRAVLFDLDDTLYDFVSASRAALEAVSARIERELGVPAKEVRDDYVRILHAQMRDTPTAGCHSRAVRFQVFLEERRLPLRLAPVYCDAYWNALLDRAVPFDGVPEALDALRARGLRIGLGTNMTADWQIRKIDRLGIADRFDFVVSSEEAGAEKPSAEFFRYCAGKAGCDVSECLFIGDNPAADVQGALAAGMQALWFLRDSAKASAHPELPVLSSFRDLPGLLPA